MKYFEKKLLSFYKKDGRKNLPWRKKGIRPYEVWVSEIFLQQTQVSRVVPYFERFMKKYPNIEKLSKTTWKEFLTVYQGLGYYQRGKNMLRTAQIIVRNFSGRFPSDRNMLLSLPGIGPYTADAILSFAFGKNVFAFDTNLRRVFGRYYYGTRNAQIDEKIVSQDFATKSRLNSAIMDFANTVCLKNPRCHVCPVSTHCKYFQQNGKQEMNGIKVRSDFPNKDAQVFLWLHNNHKKYYSKNPDKFEVFILPPKMNTRNAIKKYFEKKYNLQISVRPPKKKIYVSGKPTLLVNAQILDGKHEFGVFSFEEMHHSQNYLE